MNGGQHHAGNDRGRDILGHRAAQVQPAPGRAENIKQRFSRIGRQTAHFKRNGMGNAFPVGKQMPDAEHGLKDKLYRIFRLHGGCQKNLCLQAAQHFLFKIVFSHHSQLFSWNFRRNR
jgi:hypothetical protein